MRHGRGRVSAGRRTEYSPSLASLGSPLSEEAAKTRTALRVLRALRVRFRLRALRALRAGVRKTVMLTGDAKNVAEKVAAEVGLTDFRAVLDMQTRLAEHQDALAQARGDTATALLEVWKTLGAPVP